MEEHKIRLFDKLRLDIALIGNVIHGLFLHFLVFGGGKPHVSVHGAPNPSGRYRGYFTPHFTAWLGMFRRTLARVAPAAVERFFKEYTREGMKHFVRALTPIDVAALEADGWVFIEVPAKVFEAWIARTKRDGELIVNERTLVDLAASMFGDAVHHLPTQYVPRSGAPVIAVRTKIGDTLGLMQVAHFPDGCGMEGEDGELELAHPPGWYHLAENWWPEDARRAFFERWFGNGLGKVGKIVSKVDNYLKYVTSRRQPA
jgi:hypothetical protein